MDLNLVVLAGTLATDPEINSSTDRPGASLLVLVRTETDNDIPRAVVVPVMRWTYDSDEIEQLADLKAGDRVWVAGSVRRRFWSDVDGRRSRLEIEADQVTRRLPDSYPIGADA